MNQLCKIKDVVLIKVDIPLKQPFRIALDTIYAAKNVFVKIETEDGLIGWGEASPYQVIHGETQATCYEVGLMFVEQLIGKDALAIQHNLDLLDRIIPGNACIKSAFDIALYDIAAQAAKMPLYAYLGGTVRKNIFTDMTIGIGAPNEMARAATQLVQQGFRKIKVKLGTSLQDDLKRVSLIRQAIGKEILISIDANQGWSVQAAIQILNALEPFQIEYCEAPINAKFRDQLGHIKRQTHIPIMADESLFDHYDAMQLAKYQSVDYFNIKLGKSGGIRNAIKIAHIAEASGIPCQVGCFSESKLAITALKHFVHAFDIVQFYDMDSPSMLADDVISGGVDYTENGEIRFLDNTVVGIGAFYKQEG